MKNQLHIPDINATHEWNESNEPVICACCFDKIETYVLRKVGLKENQPICNECNEWLNEKESHDNACPFYITYYNEILKRDWTIHFKTWTQALDWGDKKIKNFKPEIIKKK